MSRRFWQIFVLVGLGVVVSRFAHAAEGDGLRVAAPEFKWEVSKYIQPQWDWDEATVHVTHEPLSLMSAHGGFLAWPSPDSEVEIRLEDGSKIRIPKSENRKAFPRKYLILDRPTAAHLRIRTWNQTQQVCGFYFSVGPVDLPISERVVLRDVAEKIELHIQPDPSLVIIPPVHGDSDYLLNIPTSFAEDVVLVHFFVFDVPNAVYFASTYDLEGFQSAIEGRTSRILFSARLDLTTFTVTALPLQ